MSKNVNILALPYEELQVKLAEYPLTVLDTLCRTDAHIAWICHQDYFWHIKSLKELGPLVSEKNPGESWKDFYFSMLNRNGY